MNQSRSLLPLENWRPGPSFSGSSYEAMEEELRAPTFSKKVVILITALILAGLFSLSFRHKIASYLNQQPATFNRSTTNSR